MEIIWEHEGNQVAYRVTQMPEDYDQRGFYFWERIKDIKTGWSEWKLVMNVEYWNDGLDMCDDDECDTEHTKSDNRFHAMLRIILDDAKNFKDVRSVTKKRIKKAFPEEPKI